MKTNIINLFEKGWEFWKISNIEATVKTAIELIEINRKHKNKEAQARGLVLLAATETYFSNFSSALKKLFQAESIIKNDDNSALKSLIYNNIGRCYGLINQQEKSLFYFKKALEIKPDNYAAISNTGVSLLRQKRYKEALKLMEKSQKLVSSDKDENKNRALNYLNLGNVKFYLGRYDESLQDYESGIPYAKKGEIHQILGSLYSSKATIFIKRKQFSHAISTLQKAEKIFSKIKNIKDLSLVYSKYSNLYESRNDIVNALKFSRKYSNLLEKFYEKDISKKIKNLESKYSIEIQLESKKREDLEKSKILIERRLQEYKDLYSEKFGIGEIGIYSEKFKHVIELAKSFHKNPEVPILIEGETGTGKEIIARVIHFGNSGNSAPFISINCSAISPELFESELFGYEEGSFTGASKKGKIGKLQLAASGTIFLDEIGELPISLQPKLLRVLQEKEFYPIGSENKVQLKARVIAATNRELMGEVEKKNFRADLYYRLNTGKIVIPPLRERKEEIEPFVFYFMKKFNQEKKREFQTIENDALEILKSHNWPGNVREISNTIERIILLHDDFKIRKNHLSFMDSNANFSMEKNNVVVFDLEDDSINMKNIQLKFVKEVLKKFDGNKAKTARFLNVTRKTIYNYLNKSN